MKNLLCFCLLLLFCYGCIKEPGIRYPPGSGWVLSKITTIGPDLASYPGRKLYKRCELLYNKHHKPWLILYYSGMSSSITYELDTTNVGYRQLESIDTIYYNGQGQPVKLSPYSRDPSAYLRFNNFFYGNNKELLSRETYQFRGNSCCTWIATDTFSYDNNVITKITRSQNFYIDTIDVDTIQHFYDAPRRNFLHSGSVVHHYGGYDNKPNALQYTNVNNALAFVRIDILDQFHTGPWLSKNNYTTIHSSNNLEESRVITYNEHDMPVTIRTYYYSTSPHSGQTTLSDSSLTWLEYRKTP